MSSRTRSAAAGETRWSWKYTGANETSHGEQIAKAGMVLVDDCQLNVKSKKKKFEFVFEKISGDKGHIVGHYYDKGVKVKHVRSAKHCRIKSPEKTVTRKSSRGAKSSTTGTRRSTRVAKSSTATHSRTRVAKSTKVADATSPAKSSTTGTRRSTRVAKSSTANRKSPRVRWWRWWWRWWR